MIAGINKNRFLSLTIARARSSIEGLVVSESVVFFFYGLNWIGLGMGWNGMGWDWG